MCILKESLDFLLLKIESQKCGYGVGMFIMRMMGFHIGVWRLCLFCHSGFTSKGQCLNHVLEMHPHEIQKFGVSIPATVRLLELEIVKEKEKRRKEYLIKERKGFMA
jgi:hypothetical protein